MLKNLSYLTRVDGRIVVKPIIRGGVNPFSGEFPGSSNCDEISTGVNQLHISSELCKERDRRFYLQGHQKPEEGTEGENLLGVDEVIKKREDMFTDERTPHLLSNGVKYSEIPICHIRVTKNNTIVHITDHNGIPMLIRSCGMEGFKNSRKGTNVAAQATALTLSKKAVQRGLKDVRVKIRGLGPGRMSSVKGLEMGGLNIVSITDDTRVPLLDKMPRPRKARRV